MKRWRTPAVANGAGLLVLCLLAASCTAILGIDKDYREGSGGAGAGAGGDEASGSEATSAASVSSSSTGGAGGAAMTVWQSWDIQVMLGKVFVYDTNGHNAAAIVPYQSRSLTDLGVDLALSTFIPSQHPDGFSNVANYWVPDVASKYPYVGQSTVPRGMDGGESKAPNPLDVFDLQLFPPADTNKLIVAAFVVPFDGDYTISALSARRVSGNGNNSALRVFVGNLPAGPTALVAKSDKAWINDGMTYPLGKLMMGAQINFAVDSMLDWKNDATEIAWIITAK